MFEMVHGAIRVGEDEASAWLVGETKEVIVMDSAKGVLKMDVVGKECEREVCEARHGMDTLKKEMMRVRSYTRYV